MENARPDACADVVAALRESEERYRRLIELLPSAVAVHRDGEIVFVNPAAVSLMRAHSADELVGMPIMDAVVPEMRPAVIARIRDALSNGVDPPLMEERFIARDGAVIDVEVRAMRITYGGDPAMLVVFRDVTAFKRAEEEKRALERQVQHVQKLESLGVLAGGIAHDFNNLLMAILGNIDLALADLEGASPIRRNLAAAEVAARRAADLSRQMLAYSGKGRFVVEPTDLNALVEETARMLEVSVPKKVCLRYALAPGLPAIEVDAAQIRQVVMNLVLNAAEAIGDRPGTIAVATAVEECDRALLSRAWLDEGLPEGRYLSLAVEDTGCGMDRATVARVFDPFFTTKFTGRGLGLAVVLGIVRGHRGAIEVQSEVDEGSRFRVLLPLSEAPLRAAPPPGLDDGWRGRGTILLVDDEAHVRDIAAQMLERIGFSVLTASDGLEAVDVYASSSRDAPSGEEAIVGIVLDLTMPKMDGEETFRELRKVSPDVPIFLSSGYGEHEVVERFQGQRLAGFIQKPYRLETLAAALRSLAAI